MELLIGTIVVATISFFIGYSTGVKHGASKILGILNIPDGYEIDGVSYRKSSQNT